ncbi:hypothetical protein AMTRI_Chr02g220550 [Amborella trichopoda]
MEEDQQLGSSSWMRGQQSCWIWSAPPWPKVLSGSLWKNFSLSLLFLLFSPNCFCHFQNPSLSASFRRASSLLLSFSQIVVLQIFRRAYFSFYCSLEIVFFSFPKSLSLPFLEEALSLSIFLPNCLLSTIFRIIGL